MFSYFYLTFIIVIIRGFSVGPIQAGGFVVFNDKDSKHSLLSSIANEIEIKSSNYVPSVLQDLYQQMTLKKTCNDDVIHTIIAIGINALDNKKELIRFSAYLNNQKNQILKSELHLVFSAPPELSRIRLINGENNNFINPSPRSNISGSDKNDNFKEIYNVTEIVTKGSNIAFKFLRESDSNSLEDFETLRPKLLHAFILCLEKSSKPSCDDKKLRSSSKDLKISSYVRRKRNNPRSRTGCRRTSKFVHFRDIGWDKWIIFPDGYEKYTCEGGCQFPTIFNHKTSNEALVQALLHRMNHANAPAYCAPSELSNLNMIYRDSANEDVITLGPYPELVVESCGCV